MLIVGRTSVDVLEVAGVDVLAIHSELGPLREGERRPLLLVPVADAADFQGLHQRRGGSTLVHLPYTRDYYVARFHTHFLTVQ